MTSPLFVKTSFLQAFFNTSWHWSATNGWQMFMQVKPILSYSLDASIEFSLISALAMVLQVFSGREQKLVTSEQEVRRLCSSYIVVDFSESFVTSVIKQTSETTQGWTLPMCLTWVLVAVVRSSVFLAWHSCSSCTPCSTAPHLWVTSLVKSSGETGGSEIASI